MSDRMSGPVVKKCPWAVIYVRAEVVRSGYEGGVVMNENTSTASDISSRSAWLSRLMS